MFNVCWRRSYINKIECSENEKKLVEKEKNNEENN